MTKKEIENRINIAGLLTLTLIILEITGVINWDWWTVMSPLWIVFMWILGYVIFPPNPPAT